VKKHHIYYLFVSTLQQLLQNCRRADSYWLKICKNIFNISHCFYFSLNDHGSTAENVAMGSRFRMAIDEWLTIILTNVADQNPTERIIVLSNFEVKHKELFNVPLLLVPTYF